MLSSSKDRLVSHPHQSLYTHLRHVDEVSKRALARKVLAPTLFAGDSVDDLRRLLVYFHDFGKGTAFFQYMITDVARRENPEMDGLDADYTLSFAQTAEPVVAQIGREGGFLRGHSQLGAFVALTALPDDIDSILGAILYETIARHHGNLRDFDAAAENGQGAGRGAEDHAVLLNEQWPRMNHADYQAILAETGFKYKHDLATVRHAGRELFFGKVYRRLKRNGDLLPYLRLTFLFSLLLAGDKGDLMLPERSLVGRGRRCKVKLIEQYKRGKFGKPGGSQMNEWREEAYRNVETNLRNYPAKGFYSITLPTGMGKTLTAYNAAILLQNLLADEYGTTNPNCIPRIIYCLPFTSVIDQNAGILEDIMALDPDLRGELAKHHYLADWADYRGDHEQRLRYSEKEYLVEGWEYTFTVTTFVQLLETIVSNRNRKLRKFHNLANAIVVLDEVQNIPPKYFNLVSRLFGSLHEQLGTRFVFVTATQPVLMNPADGFDVLELTDPSLDYTRTVFERMNRIDLDLSLWLDGLDDLPSQIELFAEAIRTESESSFLIIANLIRESQEIFQALSNGDEPNTTYLYLSGAILPVLRKGIIQQIKDRKPDERFVVVSTQVIEAGVDIDLDVVYRAFAPLDSINQSAGRCNRNMTAGRRGSVRVFKNRKSAEKIYDVALLDKTRRTLEAQLRSESEREDGRPGVIPEARFYGMNQRYAVQVRQAVADGNQTSIDILDDLYKLRLESAERKFKLIDKSYTTYGVFIDDPERLPRVEHKAGDEVLRLTSSEVYHRMRAILDDEDLGRWEKKQQLRLLRPALLQFVVQFPESKLPEDLRREAEWMPFIRLHSGGGDHDYSRCYDLITGYKDIDAPPTNLSI